MKIFGKRGCDECSSWKIRFNIIDNDPVRIAEQLTEEEAKKIFEEIKKKLEDNSSWIEVEHKADDSRECEVFNKTNIISIEMY